MSSDLEKLAKLYRDKFDDEDLAEILNVVSRISRRRERPEHILSPGDLGEVTYKTRRYDMWDWDEKLPQDTRDFIEHLNPQERSEYERYQEELLRTFQVIAPRRQGRRGVWALYDLAPTLNYRFGEKAPDYLPLSFLTLPQRTRQWKRMFSYDAKRYSALLSGGYEVDATARENYNEHVYSYMREGLTTLGEVRAAYLAYSHRRIPYNAQFFMHKAYQKEPPHNT